MFPPKKVWDANGLFDKLFVDYPLILSNIELGQEGLSDENIIHLSQEGFQNSYPGGTWTEMETEAILFHYHQDFKTAWDDSEPDERFAISFFYSVCFGAIMGLMCSDVIDVDGESYGDALLAGYLWVNITEITECYLKHRSDAIASAGG
jgi:hypothetical protein